MTKELRTLVHVSTTEHDLDAAPADGRADDGRRRGRRIGRQRPGFRAGRYPRRQPMTTSNSTRPMPMYRRGAQDIDIADDDDLDVDSPATGTGADDDDDAVEDRLGSYDAFLAEAQADGFDGADPSYQLPMVVSATEVDDVVALADDREPDVAEPDVSETSSRSCAGRTSMVRPSPRCRTTIRSRSIVSSSVRPSTTRRRCRSRSPCRGCSAASRVCVG